MQNKEQLIKEYVKLAKRANKRLYNLEKLSKEKNFEVVTKWSYARAMHDIKIWGGNKRFRTSIPEDINIKRLSAMRNDVYNFLNSKSSTKKDIVKLYIEKTNTFNKNYNTNWTWQDMASYFENGGAKEKIEEKFSSKTALEIIGVFRSNPEQIKKVIDTFNKKHKYDKDVEEEVAKLKNNEITENNKKTGINIIDKKNLKTLSNMLKDNKLEWDDFF